VRAGDAPSLRVADAIATWFDQNRRGYAVRCGDCDLAFDGRGRPRAFVIVLPVLDPSADGAAIAFCGACARHTDDELEAAAAMAMHGAGNKLIRRLAPGAVHAEAGCA
jgi:hypothetical protein